jgi:hypothetical protein
MIALLLLASTFAEDGVDRVPSEAAPGEGVAESAPPLFDIDRTIAQAIELRQEGDVAGAATLLAGLNGLVPPEKTGWWLYQRGICEELRWNFAEARVLYERVLSGPDPLPDARYRLALVLEDLGDPAGALEQMQVLARLKGLDERDAATVALQTAISEVNSGKRRGLKDLQAALAPLEGTPSHTWLRAKGHYAVAHALLAEADALRLQGSEKKVVKRVKGRVARITAAEGEITTLVRLAEPEWIVAAMILLGDSYKKLGDDLEASPAPGRLDEAEVELYRAGLGKYVENARTKAWHYWDQGVEVANRLGFESPKVQVLKERRDSLSR